MPIIVLCIGVVLVALGAYTYLGSLTGSAMTLIPAMFGAPLVVLGLVGQLWDKGRKHAMHASALIALLGLLAGIGPIAMGGGSRFPPLMMQGVYGMMALSAILLAAAIGSFILARRAAREA